MDRRHRPPENTPIPGPTSNGPSTVDGNAALDPWLVADVPHGLPLGLTEFVGRSLEMAQVIARLETFRVVTLTGPAGIGKTRLALEVAGRLRDSFAGGAWFVDLSPVHEPHLVAHTAAAALGIDPEPGRDPLETLTAHLGGDVTLLVIDNCEHLVEACAALVEALIDRCPSLSVLATSQRALGVTGERAQAVTPLTLPEPRPTPSIGSALESEAVRLFCTRASASHRGFRLTEEVLPSVAEICHRLDGIPLAIELAAVRIGVLGPAEIAERIEERFRLLTNGSSEAPPRHQTLRAALDWSHDLLTHEEATLFRRISVFLGGAGLPAVEDVCRGTGVSRGEIVDLLASLVAKSLVVADTSRARARYHLLDTVRMYGWERLQEAGEADTISSRHAAWYTAMVERRWHQITMGGARDCLAMLETEHDNLRAAMEWSAEADPGMGLRLTSALTPFWKTRGHLAEGRQWLRRMLDAAGTSAKPAMRARALWGFGMLSALQGNVDEARSALEDTLALARQAKLPRAEAQALNLLAFVSVFTQDPLAAKPLLEESVAMARQHSDLSSVGASLTLLGRAHILLGELDEARAVYEECLSIADDDGCWARFGLAWTAMAAGEEEKARELFVQVAPLLSEAGERYELALAQSFLGELAWAAGDLESARNHFQGGRDLARIMGTPFPLVRSLAGLAILAQAGGDADAAAALIEEACQVSTSARLPYAHVRCLQVVGDIRAAAGDPEAAQAAYEEALSVARANSDQAGVASSLHRLAIVARARCSDDEAMALLHEAVTLQARIGSAGLPSCLEAIAGMGAAHGRPHHAARLYGAAEALRAAQGSHRRTHEAAAYEVDLAQLRSALPAEDLAEAWVDGASLSREEVVALALRGRGTRDRDRPVRGWASLTRTEREVADLVTKGMTNKEVAAQLFMSTRTVQGHLSRIFRKLEVTSRYELRKARPHVPA